MSELINFIFYFFCNKKIYLFASSADELLMSWCGHVVRQMAEISSANTTGNPARGNVVEFLLT